MPVDKPILAGAQLTERADLRRIEVDNMDIESPDRT